MQRFFFFFFCVHLGYFTCAQGPELLIQQYDQGPDLEYYRKWNFDVFIQPHLTNTADLNTKGRIQLDVGGNVHYRFDKNFGLSSGIHYQRISYAYALANDTSIDRLRFLRFPLVLSVYPVKRVQLSLGGSYHLALKASGQPPGATERSFYPSKTFVNSLGCDCASTLSLVAKIFSLNFVPFSKTKLQPHTARNTRF